jgi:hypothetical protein
MEYGLVNGKNPVAGIQEYYIDTYYIANISA